MLAATSTRTEVTATAASPLPNVAESDPGTRAQQTSTERRDDALRKAGLHNGEKREYVSDSNGTFFFRPHRAMGIDMKPFHEAQGFEREPLHAVRTGTAMDFANPLHACVAVTVAVAVTIALCVALDCSCPHVCLRVCRMNFALQSNASGFNVGAIGGWSSTDGAGTSTDGEEDSPTMGRD
jgi:hypothetical protein